MIKSDDILNMETELMICNDCPCCGYDETEVEAWSCLIDDNGLIDVVDNKRLSCNCELLEIKTRDGKTIKPKTIRGILTKSKSGQLSFKEKP